MGGGGLTREKWEGMGFIIWDCELLLTEQRINSTQIYE